MHTTKLKVTFTAESADYFWIDYNMILDTFTITFGDGSGHPVHLSGITPKQLAGLEHQIDRARMAQSSHKLTFWDTPAVEEAAR